MHERRKLPKGSPQEEMEAARRELEIVSQSRKASKTKGNIHWYICLVNEYHKGAQGYFRELKPGYQSPALKNLCPN